MTDANAHFSDRKPVQTSDDPQVMAAFWLDSALRCPAFQWDADQQLAAELALRALLRLLESRPTPSEPAALPAEVDRAEAAQALLTAAQEFWYSERQAGAQGAVKWLTGDDGSLVIFTRGEYRDTLMGNIDAVACKEHFFATPIAAQPAAAEAVARAPWSGVEMGGNFEGAPEL